MKISKKTVFLSLIIILSSAFSRKLLSTFQLFYGRSCCVTMITLIFVICYILFLFFLVKRYKGTAARFVSILLLLLGLIVAWQLDLPEERVHILEFGILGWVVGRDLIREKNRKKIFIFSCMYVCFVGIIDEIFQGFLPDRFFDVRDIAFNAIGGAWGAGLCLLSKK